MKKAERNEKAEGTQPDTAVAVLPKGVEVTFLEASRDGAEVAPLLDRLPIFDSGDRGPIKVTLRDPQRGLKFDEPGIRMVPIADAQDLLSPAIGGGSFSRALPLSGNAAWRPEGFSADLAALAAADEITVVAYRPVGAAEPGNYLVFDAKTRRRLNQLKKAEG